MISACLNYPGYPYVYRLMNARHPVKKLLLAAAIVCGIITTPGARSAHLSVGDSVPAFSLTDQQGKLFSSTDYIGKKALVIYFYPKDETSVCTKEACAFRDSYADFEAAGAMVIGINSGTVESHRDFAAHHTLPFTLLSDPGNTVLKQFGVRSKLMITGRETFVADRQGKIIYTFNSMMQGEKHAQEALKAIKAQ